MKGMNKSNAADLQQRTNRLAQRCDSQVEFARDYAPFYARLFAIMGQWFSAPDALADPLVTWLLDVSAQRAPFDVPLLLLAAVHREVLAGDAPELAEYYPTVGGTRAMDAQLATTLRAAILNRPKPIAHFVQTANVQTNETARGMIWLLPLQAWPVSAVHLVDLGASAGLNLVAEKRAYQLFADDDLFLQIGTGQAPQFTTNCTGAVESLPQRNGQLPAIESRIGSDMLPFVLDSAEKERNLAAYIWADQPHRLQRLQEGIAAFHTTNQHDTPVQLFSVTLPDQLAGFLETTLSSQLRHQANDEPVILYNTYMTNYLPDKGAALRVIIDHWARQQPRPCSGSNGNRRMGA